MIKGEIIDRLKSETPVFFKRIRNIAASLSAGCIGAAVFYPQLPEAFQTLIDPSLIKTIATTGIVAALVAQCAKQDK